MAQPALPKTLAVGPYTYAVEDCEALDADDLRAVTDTDRHTIRIVTACMSPALARSTLLHEALHAVHVTAGITGDAKLTPEQFVSRCEPGLYALLRDNPSLVAFLLAP